MISASIGGAHMTREMNRGTLQGCCSAARAVKYHCKDPVGRTAAI